MQEVSANSQGKIQMGPGTLYGSIKRMLEAGLIEESEDRPDPDLDDERRRYYRISDIGRKVLAAEVERMSQLVQVAHAKRVADNAAPRFQTGA